MTPDLGAPPRTPASHNLGLSPGPARGPVRGARWGLLPGWPLTWLLVGYPLWWLLGIAQVLSLVAAALLLLELVRARRVVAPRGFLLWLLFLVWLVGGLAVLQVDAPGTVHGPSPTRYLTFSFRLAWYVAATVVLLYLGNMRGRISELRIARAFAVFFLTVVAGGILGTVAPNLDFPSALELLLPRRVSGIPFVRDLVHPVVAQRNLVDNVENPRASAPFAYTNGWALNFAVLLPLFLVSWLGPGAGWRRRLAPVVLAVALVPVIVSVNRGLWIAIGVTALFVAVRAAASGRPRLLAAVVVGAAVVVTLVLASPLGATVEHRLDNGYSDDGRANLSTTTVRTALDASPVVGFGTTRDVQGSFTSIAGGATPSCPQCSPPALGTQGHLWGLVFATGVVGLGLYLGFYLALLVRGRRLTSPYAVAGMSVIVAHLATMPFYDIIGSAMFTIAAGAALVWRAELDAADRRRTDDDRPGPPTLGGYAAFVRDHGRTVVACAAVGLLLGGWVAHAKGPMHAARVSVLLPREPEYPGADRRATTLDTFAQLVRGQEVQDAVARATRRPRTAEQRDVAVGATPNTRVLEITVEDPDRAAAERTAHATATALLEVRARDLAERRRTTLDDLRAEESGVARALATLDRAIDRAAPGQAARMDIDRTKRLARLNELSATTATVVALPLDAGGIAKPATAWTVTGKRNVDVTSGTMLGLLVGVVAALLRHVRGTRLPRRPRRGPDRLGGLPVLARLDPTGTPGRAATAALSVHGPATFLPVDVDPDAQRVVDQLRAALPATGTARDSLVLVLTERARRRDVARLVSWGTSVGVRPRGAVVLGRRPRRGELHVIRPPRRREGPPWG